MQCSVVCEPVGLLASLWNIPLVATYCSSNLLSDRRVYPTFSRVRGDNVYTSRVIKNMLQKFSWQRFSIISNDDSVFKLAAEYLLKFSEKHDMDARLYTLSTTVVGENVDNEKLSELQSLIHTLKETSMVILLYIYDSDLRHFLILARQHGLLNGDFVFIGLDGAYRGSTIALREIEPQTADGELYQGLIAVTEGGGQNTAQWEEIRNETFSYYSLSNISRQEMETAIERDFPFSGEK